MVLSFSLLVVILFPTARIRCQPEDILSKNKWYTKYSQYPSLCSTPQQMEQRHIPPLPPTNNAYASQLRHLSVVIRHGSRAPTDMHPCWKGYNHIGSDTAVWNCDLMALSSTPILHSPTDRDSMLIYEKKYDALSSSSSSKQTQNSNVLNGTCEVAQLLERGYDQEYNNGNILKSAYGNTLDPRLLLFNSSYNPTDIFDLIYFRSDDDPRTLMSGQVLLHGFFDHSMVLETNNPRMTVHTADRTRDIMAPNENSCPRLTLLSHRAKQSRDYTTQFIQSKEANTMQTFAIHELGVEESSMNNFRDHALDCLITTICTDRDLPPPLQEVYNNTIYGPNLFQRLLDYSVLPKTFIYRFNDSAYSKLSMIPLWNEIRDHLPLTQYNDSNRTVRLALYSGHDTTLIPLLSSLGSRLWDGSDWIPYASMMILEIHDIILNPNESDSERTLVRKKFPSNKAFRILYNGQVLTDKIDGCTVTSDLCDISFLIHRLDFLTSMDYASACRITEQENSSSNTLFQDISHDVSLAKTLFHTSGGFAFLILMISVTAFLSSIVTYVIICRRCPSWCRCTCCCSKTKQRSDFHVRDYESTAETLNTERNDNFVKPGWKDSRRKNEFRYVEVPSWFVNNSDMESRDIT